MQTTKQTWKGLNILALVLVLPTSYFMFVSLLKYQMGVDSPYDSISPFLENMGIRQNLGWNINLLFLFGPLISFAIAAWQILRINLRFSKEEFGFNLIIHRKNFALIIALLSGLVLAGLTIYVVAENMLIR
jgi:hypothetical protein